MSLQQSECVSPWRNAGSSFATQGLIILVCAGSKPDRPSSDSSGGLTIKWEEFSAGKHSGQGLVSFKSKDGINGADTGIAAYQEGQA